MPCVAVIHDSVPADSDRGSRGQLGAVEGIRDQQRAVKGSSEQYRAKGSSRGQ